MMKFNTLICVFSVILHYGNSEQLNFGNFLGGCPEVESVPRSVFEEGSGSGEWYTQRVAAGPIFSPWKFMRCQSSSFDFNSVEDSTSTVKTRFQFPILPVPFEIQGTVEKIKPGEYSLNYQSPVFGNIFQKTSILRRVTNGALVYTCLDFKFFHLESIQIISKFKASDETNNNDAIIQIGVNDARRFGIPAGSFVEIDQSC